MLTIEKLSEKNLEDVLKVLFPFNVVERQKRFKGDFRDFIICPVKPRSLGRGYKGLKCNFLT